MASLPNPGCPFLGNWAAVEKRLNGMGPTVYILVITTVATVTAVNCPTGNVAGVVKDGMTCSELISAKSYECYNSDIETQCCSSCNDIARTDPDCLYGDRQPCFAFACSTLVNKADCCVTCAESTTSSSSTSTSTTSTTSTTSITSTSTSSMTSSSTTTVFVPVATSSNTSSAPGTSLTLLITSSSSLSPAFSSSSQFSAGTTSPSSTSAVTSLTMTSTARSTSLAASPSPSSAVGAIVGGVIGGVAGVALLTTIAFVVALKLKKCCKNKIFISGGKSADSLPDKLPLALNGKIAESGPRETKDSNVLGNDKGLTENGQVYKNNKMSLPPEDTYYPSPLKDTMYIRNEAKEFQNLHEILNTPEVSYVFTIEPPTLTEVQDRQIADAEEGANGREDNSVREATDSDESKEMSGDTNENISSETDLKGGFEVVDITFS